MNKGQLSHFLRRAGLMHLADRLRYRWLRHRNRALNQAFRRAHPAVALPPDYLMYESFQLDYGKYYHGGQETAAWVKQHLERFLPLAGQHVVDWGCGPGRVIRHLPQAVGQNARFTGVDYNPRSIAWCQANVPGVTFLRNALAPPLPLAGGSADALYGISIFTHLAEDSHRRWFAELLRVVRPGGVLLLTTQGAAFRGLMTPAEQARFDAGHLVVRQRVDEGHRVFSAFQPAAFLRQLFLPETEVLDHIAGECAGARVGQDVWLLRKK